MHADAALAALRQRLGSAVVTDPIALDALRTDKSGHRSTAAPLALVEPTSVEQVQQAMRGATEFHLPVVPRGAGTGLAGAAIGGAGELVLSLRKMDRILRLEADDEYVVVEPGVLNGDLNAWLAPHGLWYAPDPASRAISTIGGNLATNAGGLQCVKYGVTREAVLGMKVVLADGRLVELGHRTVKGVTGYDLTALMIGSEGTLGVIVEATLAVHPIPAGEPATIAASFASVERAADAATAIIRSGVRPASLELLDAAALRRIGEHLGLDLADRGAQLLVQTDGPSAAADADAIAVLLRDRADRVELSRDRAEGERLFAIRRAFHPAMEAHGTVLIEDVAVPRSRLAAMFAEIGRIEREFGIEIPTVAHAGDGNLHPNFVIPAGAGEGEVPDQVWQAADALFRACLALGGTLTGEHGVGILKARWLRDELGEDGYALQHEVKRVFDPLGILNPGKVFARHGSE